MRRPILLTSFVPALAVLTMVLMPVASSSALPTVEVATPDGSVRIHPRELGVGWQDGKITMPDGALDAVLADLAASYRRPPVEGRFVLDGDDVGYEGGSPGAELDVEGAADVLVEAFMGRPGLAMPIDPVQPKTMAVVARLSEFRLDLYEGPNIRKSYPIGVGQLGYHLHLGEYQVSSKAKHPSWRNPGAAWAKSMPAYVPPGPNNPLGSRALRLDRDLLAIHRTPQPWTVGTRASRGCMRMLKDDVEELFDIVDVGTQVFIFE